MLRYVSLGLPGMPVGADGRQVRIGLVGPLPRLVEEIARGRMPQRAEDNERVLPFRRLPVVLLAAGERGDLQPLAEPVRRDEVRGEGRGDVLVPRG